MGGGRGWGRGMGEGGVGGGGGAVPFFILSMNPMLNETGLERIGERREMLSRQSSQCRLIVH